MAGFTIEHLVVPARIEDADAADFLGMTDVRNACEVAGFGGPEFAHPAAELLPSWHDRHEPTIGFVAKIDGRVVARGVHETRLGEAASTAWLTVQVHPDLRGRGIGRALADRLEDLAAAQGQTTLIVYAVSPDGPGERLAPSTGAGSVPLHNREVQFLLARGYVLGQVNRASKLVLPVDPALLDEIVANIADVVSPDYRILCWVGRTPDEHKEGLRILRSRMTTDAPLGDLDEPAEEWTIERLDDYEREIDDGPRFMVTAAAQHIPSGELVGFTELMVASDASRPVDQEDTIVLTEHRGHRLGMLLKIANIRQLEAVAPGHPSIITFNAEENRPMLDVNEAVGFVPVGYEAAWQRTAERPAPQVE